MSSGKIKNIILDLGNTLVFFDYGYFYEGIAKLEKDVSAGSLKKYFVDNDFDIKIGSGQLNIKDTFSILRNKFNLKTGYEEFYDLYCDIFYENTDMKNFVENELLDSSYRLYMLSNVDHSHINFINNNFPYIKNIKKRVLSYKAKCVKPDKKIYEHTLDKFKIVPGESIFIDDLRKNILAAKAMGFNTIHYTSHNRFLREFNKLTKQQA